MQDKPYFAIARDGLWNNNPGLVQLLGLCPLLAVSATVVNALGLGFATLLTLTASNVSVSLIRKLVREEIRIPVFVLIIASFVTAVEMAMNAYFHQLYLILGIFIPLIVTNCSILARAETFASRTDPARAAADGLAMGVGFTGVLVTLGAMRELLGQGTLLANAQMLAGQWGQHLTVHVIPDYDGFLLAMLPPGAFIGLGLLLALKNVIDDRSAQRRRAGSTAVDRTETPVEGGAAA